MTVGMRGPAENAGVVDVCEEDSGRFGAPGARCAVGQMVIGGTTTSDNELDGEKARQGWIKTDYTDAEAIEVLRRADSGVRPDLSRHGYRFVKRAFDIVASGAAIALLLVPGLILSAVICIKSPGAGPLYSQVRVGRLRGDGTFRLFRMLKFRSMVPRADKMLAELRDKNEADGPLFKIKDDPRIIPGVGQFIRKHSIDELPQLLNVFAGQMSLIGPRPALPSEVMQYDERAMLRLTVKPGCGGAWQAGERSDSTFEGMIDADLEYIEASSFRHDLALIFGTLRSMLDGKGAY
ncbi:MAG TPA: sugar transferase [Collinsella ihuae]|uniref:Sugar transferase n=1 Tax=Collinsella ihumii TaxID=1720204 RepID=A0A921IQ96_9ACTN|nr:sugar transferase [Collinsella ihumii]